ncbi:MAG TPA: ribosome-associated translation inhibitor RaiA [Candidatus Paceibacterota bacterium]|jgi:ribosomal subunit interface protein|nr:ribosome-associated translation inhibitor RaiA [Candidatus Pacearchaeota archaeon]HPZ74664.1 ribosome-associated translation inhibitor RaiA [Candidatus Pacearchaeota archaeon]HQD89197.1 ribosome-associated translation inhibitor RaiA [Candidatus Pacearchaeota archaeon]HRR39366.1 ribosome-associated translation inhibitor RaiA [Candidatus Paceibacterota bacterium]
MKFQIKSTNIVLTESLRNYIEEKIGKCERFIQLENFPLKAYVEIEKITDHHRKGDIFRAEVNMELPGKLLHCDARKNDIYLAINAVRNKLEREIKEYKELKK